MSSPTGPGDTPRPASAADTGAFRFGRFELHPDRRELLRDGEPVELQANVFDFIAYLLANRGRAVDKGELLDAVWPRQVVTEAALSRCVMKARRALEDEADSPQVILTVHGRGYRFIAAVEPVADRRAAVRGGEAETAPTLVAAPDAAPQAAPAPAPGIAPAAAAGTRASAPATGLRRFGWPALLAAGLALLLAWWWPAGDRPGEATMPRRLAVLPIANATGEPRFDWARLGLMEALTETLRSDMPVVAPAEVFDLTDSQPDLAGEALQARIHEAFGASHVVSGELHRGGGQLRLDFRVHGADGRLRRRSVVATDVPGLARAAAADLAASLGQPPGAGPVLDDAFANEAYLRGLALRLQGDVAGAQRYFQLALEQAPEGFWPRLQLAIGQLDLGEMDAARAALEALLADADAGGDALRRLSVRNALATLSWRAGDNARARPLLEQALVLARELDDPDAETSVLSRLGILATYADGFDEAHAHLDAALAAQRRAGIDTPSSELRHSLGQLALREGDLVSAGTHIEAAVAGFRLQGNRRSEAVALNSLSNLRRRQGRFVEARDLAADTVRLHRELRNPSSESAALISLATAQAQLGELEAAADTARQALDQATALKQAPRQASAASLLGQFSVDLGRHADARRHLEQARDLMQAIGDPIGVLRQRLWLARLAAAEGDTARAVAEARAVLADAGSADTALIRLDVLRNLAIFHFEDGDAAGARGWLAQAMAVADTLDDPRRSAQLQAWLALVELAEGDADAAARALERAAPALADDPLLLQADAALRAARGDAAGALAREREAKSAYGQRWRPRDEARLAAREAAAR